MTVEEIFSEISTHQIKGIMIHEQLANYFDFLGLRGYKRCHEYHSICEFACYRKLNRYFINHYNKLLPERIADIPKIVPSNWYNYTRQEVDLGTKRNAIKTAMTTWVDWEKETKKLYEISVKNLYDIDEVARSNYIRTLVDEVTEELKTAERKSLELKAVDYNLEIITPEQEYIHSKYKDMENGWV